MMKYYKNADGDVFGYEDGRDTPSGMAELSAAEIGAIFDPKPVDYKLEISRLYVSAMEKLSSKYTQKEIDTFHRKSTAATAFAGGVATDSHIYYIAKIDGVVNGTTPLTAEEKSAEVAAIDASGLEIIQARVGKILDAENIFDFFSAKIEQVRNTHLDQLVDDQDNSAVIDSLAAIYGAF